ncbi:acyl dehydratase [Nakamurella sp. YIM 132087]|uniref:Acyl dehydratase n=1 Tax=Nakamurella alba TaxID=2665158 RepID=A0A7K1FED6_9ACTN|nr:MaoC family dehydratase [Nakamurella alba]MTD12467.1 acyl dehydratase [Nakamurella alba]
MSADPSTEDAVVDNFPAAPVPRTFGPVTQTDIVRFAGAGGDFNPLHHDPGFAAEAGLGGIVAMGQFQAALLAGWVTDTFGITRLRSFEVRFTAPVRIGDVLEIGGTISDVDDDAGTTTLALSVQVGGSPVVTGTAVLRNEPV